MIPRDIIIDKTPMNNNGRQVPPPRPSSGKAETIPRDIIIDMPLTDNSGTSSDGLRRSSSMVEFRRCSLEHAKQVEEARRYRPANRTSVRRRSSLKTSSSYGSDANHSQSTAAAKKNVAFLDSVRIKIIEHRDEAYQREAWLSKKERLAIQQKAQADIRTIRNLTKNRHLVEENAALHQLRNSMSLRGLEQFYSKRIHRTLLQEQLHAICDVLEAQEYLNESARRCAHQHAVDREAKIYEVSTEASSAARQRAYRQGQEDEAAVKTYLGRRDNPTPSLLSSSSQYSSLSSQKQPSAERSSRSLEMDSKSRLPPRPLMPRRASMPI